MKKTEKNKENHSGIFENGFPGKYIFVDRFQVWKLSFLFLVTISSSAFFLFAQAKEQPDEYSGHEHDGKNVYCI